MYGNGYGYGYGAWGSRAGFGQAPIGIPQNQPFTAPYQQPAPPPQVDASQQVQRPTLQVPWVNGEVGAQAYLIAPNSTVLLMDSDNPIFYIKTSDLSGKATIQAFKYEEINPSAPVSSTAPTNYVTREEFEAFKASLSGKKEEEVKI